MPTVKISGVYKIRNKINNKVYIGQSIDIRHRWNLYKWGATSTKNYPETTRAITRAIREDGIENFEFTILRCDDTMKDVYNRLAVEAEYIMNYRSYDPEFGYNQTVGNEPYLFNDLPRIQSTQEKLKRAKPVFLFDIETRNTMFYFTGAKGVGDELGYGKDVMSHTVQRGSLIDNRYYVIPANYKERHKILEKLRVKKTQNTNQSTKAQSKSGNAFRKYELVVAYIDLVALETFGFDEN